MNDLSVNRIVFHKGTAHCTIQKISCIYYLPIDAFVLFVSCMCCTHMAVKFFDTLNEISELHKDNYSL
jgi:hypothetical protein